MRQKSPESEYRSGWRAARELTHDSLCDLIRALEAGLYRWSDWFDSKPTSNFSAGFKDYAWKFPEVDGEPYADVR